MSDEMIAVVVVIVLGLWIAYIVRTTNKYIADLPKPPQYKHPPYDGPSPAINRQLERERIDRDAFIILDKAKYIARWLLSRPFNEMKFISRKNIKMLRGVNDLYFNDLGNHPEERVEAANHIRDKVEEVWRKFNERIEDRKKEALAGFSYTSNPTTDTGDADF